MVWRKMMNNTHRENGTTVGPLIFNVPAHGFVMALYPDCLGRTPTRRFPLPCVEQTRKRRSGFGWPMHRSNPQTHSPTFFGRQEDLPEIFDRIALVSYRNGRARVG